MKRIVCLGLLLALFCGCAAKKPTIGDSDYIGSWKGTFKDVETHLTFGPTGQLKMTMLANGERLDLGGDYKMDTKTTPWSLDLHIVGEVKGQKVDKSSQTIVEMVDQNHLRYYDNDADRPRPTSFDSEHVYVLERMDGPVDSAPSASPSEQAAAPDGWQVYDLKKCKILLPAAPLEMDDPPFHVAASSGDCQVEVRWAMFSQMDEARAQAGTLASAVQGKQTPTKLIGEEAILVEGPQSSRAVVRKGPMVYCISVGGTPEQFKKVVDSFKI